MVVNTLQSRRGRRKEEMEIPLHREGREQKMVIDMLPFPTLIPVDDNDLKSMALSVEVVAPEFAFLTGGNTAHTVDVSDMAPMAMALPQKEELPVEPRPLQEVQQLQDFSEGTRVPNERRAKITRTSGKLKRNIFVRLFIISDCKNNIIYFSNLRGRGVYSELIYFM